MCRNDTINGPSIKLKNCNFNYSCGHKHDGSLTYENSTQKLKAYRKKSVKL